MQCPTCGNDTPGTLGKCSHCAAPIDVYSVGPSVPLAAPVTDAPPAADDLGDRTTMLPPPTPSWAAGSRPPAAADPVMPPHLPPSPPPMPGSADTAGNPAPDAASAVTPGIPMSAVPPVTPPGGTGQVAHGAEPRVPGAAPESGGFPAASTPPTGGVSSVTAGTPMGLPVQSGAGADPEDTAAWTFNPDEDDDSGAFGTVRQQSWEAQKPAPPAPPAPPAHNPFGLREETPPTESIVPESWFAQPRRPDPEATQVQPPAGGAQFAPAPMTHPGPGGGMEQTRLDPGSPMGAPPPMGPMGPGTPNMMGPGAPNMAGPGVPNMAGPGSPNMMGPGAPNMMGPGGPAPGYPPATGKPGGGGPSKPLIAVVAALVTVAAGAVVFAWPSGDDKATKAGATPAPSTSAPNTPVAQQKSIADETRQQAAKLNVILDDSSNTRQVLAGAIGRAGKCKTLPQAIEGFQTVAQRRQDQLRRTKELQVDKLTNGERLRGTLTQALQASLDVDLVLLRWAQANQQRGCKGGPKPAAAQVPGRAAAERRATNAKIQFVRLWNPVATKTGQPKRSWKLV